MAARLHLALVVGVLLPVVFGHGVMTQPRARGTLRSNRNINPQTLDPSAPIDNCFSCGHAGGVNVVKHHSQGNPWRPYAPMQGGRAGFGMCGDPAGTHDHMRGGKYANPPSMPFVANYAPGSVVNLEFDTTANHGGYIEFYLCDVSNMPYKDISFSGFSQYCHHLKRVPHPSCESGNDPECGPIDPNFPERWVLPCGSAGGDTGDQVLGGPNGKMAYQLPNVVIQDGVMQNYWLTTNTCNTPDGFMQNYNYPRAWGNCFGDGASIGGKPQHHLKCGEHGTWPEEFWNCADVQVMHGGTGAAPPAGGATASPATTKAAAPQGGEIQNQSGGVVEDGNCYPEGSWCNASGRCCHPGHSCINTQHGNKCILPSSYPSQSGSVVEDGNCTQRDHWCSSHRRCCHKEDVCMHTMHGNKCLAPHLAGEGSATSGNSVVEDGNCTQRDHWCSYSKRCCHSMDVCAPTAHGNKCVPSGASATSGSSQRKRYAPKTNYPLSGTYGAFRPSRR